MEHLLKSGMILDSRYRIDRMLGEGGFGITYAAENIRIGLKVAIKEFFWHDHSTRNIDESPCVSFLHAGDKDSFQILQERFLKEARIERVGVFPFSPEEGTPAAAMEHVDEEEARRRADLILQLQQPIMEDFLRGFVGRTLRVLHEYDDEESGLHVGRSYADSPDIDGLVYFSGFGAEGEMLDVLIEDVDDGFLIGRCEKEEP